MNHTYMLKTVNKEMLDRNGLKWPEHGKVIATKWDPDPDEWAGLHGLLNGEGCDLHMRREITAKWLVVQIDKTQIIDAFGAIKVPEGFVVHCGDRHSATRDLQAKGLTGPIVGATVERKEFGTAAVGHYGTAKSGFEGTSIAGIYGTAITEIEGNAVAGFGGTAIAGEEGVTSVGVGGRARVGRGGTLIFKWWNKTAWLHKTSVFYVGKNGPKPDTFYVCVAGELIEPTSESYPYHSKLSNRP